MNFGFDIANVCESTIVIVDRQVVIAVEQFPGADLLVLGLMLSNLPSL